jgi:flagellar hook-associated protein 3 FlgL
MRITNNMVSNSYLKNLNMNLTSVDKYQNQLSTGKRLTRLSDDPVGILSSMQIRVRLNRLEQYQKNVDTAGDWLTQTESSLKELDSILQTAYERAVQASTDTLEETDRLAIAEELKQLRDQVLAVGNTKVTNKYIFGGYNTSTEPFSLGATGNILYNGLDVSVDTPQLQAEAEQNISFEIGYDMNMEVFTNGLQLLGSGDSNIYNLINGMCEALESGNTQDISDYIPKLQPVGSD